jgi:ABC-type multidrug transport system ATPase subunit
MGSPGRLRDAYRDLSLRREEIGEDLECKPQGETMLSIHDLVKIYPGPVVALAGFDLDVPRGMFGLLGPNGAGKTTLMRILAGLLEAMSGTATLDGRSMLDRPERFRERLGYLPQDFGFFPHLTGERMLRYLLRFKGVCSPLGKCALCGELLDRVGLSFAAPDWSSHEFT